MEKKFFLIEYEGNEPPKMVFVSKDGRDFDLYINGKLVRGIDDITIHANIDSVVQHQILYTTALSE